MKSQIDFVDSQTLKPKPEVDAGRILVSSKNLEWEGIYIEKGENKQFNPDDVTVPQHYFAMNIGPAFEWEWKDGKTFKTHRYETGDVWINPAGVPFSHRIKTHNQFVLLTLEPAKVIDALPDYPLIDRQVFRRVHRSKDKHLQTLMQALLVEAESGGPNGRFYADTLSTALVAHFVNHYSTKIPVELTRVTAIERQRLGRVLEYIEAYLTQSICLEDLARVAGLSKFHFSRSFKAAIGVTPHQYLLKRRIEKAANALKTESIAQVAYQFGFTDQSHFTRVFKKVKDVTPKQFIRQKM